MIRLTVRHSSSIASSRARANACACACARNSARASSRDRANAHACASSRASDNVRAHACASSRDSASARARVRARNSANARAHACSGFTLVETLMALMILIIMTSIVIMGIPAAFRSYTNAVDGSNAQVLLSTATATLRDELGMAQDVDVDADGKVRAYMTGDGYWATIDSGTVDLGGQSHKWLMKSVYVGSEAPKTADSGEADSPKGTPQPLVPSGSSTGAFDLVFKTDDWLTYKNGVFTVRGLEVQYSKDHSVLASIGDQAGFKYEIKAFMLEEGR